MSYLHQILYQRHTNCLISLCLHKNTSSSPTSSKRVANCMNLIFGEAWGQTDLYSLWMSPIQGAIGIILSSGSRAINGCVKRKQCRPGSKKSFRRSKPSWTHSPDRRSGAVFLSSVKSFACHIPYYSKTGHLMTNAK